MKLLPFTVAVLALLLVQTGSATGMNSTLKIESQPSSAAISINDTYAGFTPLIIEIPDGHYRIAIIKDGYQDYIADLNVSGNETLQYNATLVPLENDTSPTEPTEEATPQSTPTAAGKVSEATLSDNGKFRVGPVVRIRPVNDLITKGEPDLVEFYFSNPSINDVMLTVEIYVSVPAGIHVFGEGFGVGGAAGSIHGSYTVPPGSDRTISMEVVGEKTGSYMVHTETIYYPGSNKDLFQQYSLTHPFKILDPVTQEESDVQSSGVAEPETTTIPNVPGFSAIMTFCVLVALFLIGESRKSS